MLAPSIADFPPGNAGHGLPSRPCPLQVAVLPRLGAASVTDVAVDSASPFIQNYSPCFSSCPTACAHIVQSSRQQTGLRKKARNTWGSSRKRCGSKIRKARSLTRGVISRSPSSDRDRSPSSPSHTRWVILRRVPSCVCQAKCVPLSLRTTSGK